MTRGSTTMKRLILFLTLALAIPLAQAQQILSLSAIAPAPVQNLQGQNGGADVAPGSGTACYYVVANYIGGAIRSTALQITTLPTSLSSTNYIQLGWSPVVGFGVTYDVLKSANCAAIAPGASVSLETGQSTTTYQDQGGGLSAYTQSGFMFQNATGLLRLNNWDYTIPQIEIKVAPPGSPRRYDPARGNVSAFLFGIARNHVLRALERDRRFTTIDAESDHGSNGANGNAAANEIAAEREDASGTHAQMERRERIEGVRRAVLSLPPAYREVVVLCDLEQRSYADAAVRLECPVGTVRSRLNRARGIFQDLHRF